MRTVSPKAHGAWLGGGTGTLIGSVVVGMIQAYANHGHALPPATITLVMGICASLVAFVGAHVMPLEYPLPYQPTVLPYQPTPPLPVVSPTTQVSQSGEQTQSLPLNDWGKS